MYEAVRAAPNGASTAARLGATAATLGYEGVVVRNWPAVADDVDDPAAYRDAVVAEYGVDVVDAAEVRVETAEQASGHLGTLRPAHTLLFVRGGSPALNRFAVDSPRVDVLTAPMSGTGDVNHVLARAAAENDVAVEFDLSRVLRADGGHRVHALRDLRKLRELVAKYDAPFVVSAGPACHLHLRSPRDLLALGERIGFDRDRVRAGLAAWGELAARNRERRSDRFVAPGVRRGRAGEDG